MPDFEMFKKEEGTEPPPPDARLWRYMDVTKLLSLLATKKLYFPRVDTLGDPWEGSLSKSTAAKMQGMADGLSDDQLSRVPGGTRQEKLRNWVRFCGGMVFVSCWHRNERESDAMWKLYTQCNEAVAITTTMERLKSSLPQSPLLTFRSVKYADHEVEDAVLPIFTKRLSFAHESEVRVVLVQNTFGDSPFDPPKGFAVVADIERLIENVYVSPLSEDWVENALQDVLGKYSLDRTVRKSALADEPYFWPEK